jgi:hypothetical protein
MQVAMAACRHPLSLSRPSVERCEEFLYTLKAGPAGGWRPPSGRHTTTDLGLRLALHPGQAEQSPAC